MRVCADLQVSFAGAKQNKYNSDDISMEKRYQKQPDAPTKVKIGSFLGTAIGVAVGVFIALKRGKIMEPASKKTDGVIKNQIADITNKKIAKIKATLKNVNYDELNVITIATGSIFGGVLGGSLADDKKNIKAKLREGLIQLGGNILIPLACVGGGSRLFKKFLEKPIINKFKITPKFHAAPGIISSALCLCAAIFLGNKATNIINEDVYHLKDDRKVKIADMSGHIDDTCLAISLANPGSKISSSVSRIIPLALLICGYSSGVMQEWPDDIIDLRRVYKKHELKK